MELLMQQPFYKRLNLGDWLFALFIAVVTGYTFSLDRKSVV